MRLFFIILLCLGGINASKAQHPRKWGWSIDGSVLLSSEYGNYIADSSVKLHYVLNKNITIGLGGMYLFTHTDNYKWQCGDYIYTYEEDSQMKINAVGNVMLNIPIVGKTGIMCDVIGFSSIFPFESVKISQSPISNITHYSEYKDKIHFDYFSSGLFTNIGVYHDFEEDDFTNRIAFSYGIGYYDPLKGSRHANVFEQNIGSHLPKQKIFHCLTLRLIFLK